MKRPILASIFIMVVFAGIVWYASANLTDLKSRETEVSAPVSTPQSIVETEQPISTKWQQYYAEQNNFSVSHPSQFSIMEREDGTTQLLFVGPTQEEDTEFFDGVSLIFSSHDIASDLAQAVQLEHDAVASGGGIENARPIEDVSLAGYQGYTFEVEGLGDYRHYFLPNELQYLKITALVADPGRNGYEELVHEILSTLTLE